MGKQNVLEIRELLENTYLMLCERHKVKQINLSQKVLAEIANDSDWHRTRVGYMGYVSAGLFQLNGNSWAIGRGEACGSYPAKPYDSDILALEFSAEGKTPEQIQKKLSEAIGKSEYFINSLIYGMANGNLAVNKDGRFRQRMLNRLKPEIQRFIAQKAVYDEQYMDLSTLRPVCKGSVKYKPEFVEFLADSIEAILKE